MSAETIVYASMAPEQSIRVYSLDAKTGKLTEIETLSVQGSPGSLAVDPSKKILLASLRSGAASATGDCTNLDKTSLPHGGWSMMHS